MARARCASHRGRLVAVLAAVLLGATLVMPAASPAYADPVADQAAAQVARDRCAKLKAANDVPDQYKNNCERTLAADLTSGRAKDPSWAGSVCKWVPNFPLAGLACRAITTKLQGTWQDYESTLNVARQAAGAIANPSSVLDGLAENMRAWLRSLLDFVLRELAHITAPDLTSASFLQSYAAGAGIAMFVLTFMIARLFFRAGRGDLTGAELSDSLFKWLPQAMLLVVFGPALGYLLVELTNAATTSIIEYFAGDVAHLAAKIGGAATVASAIPGGSLMSLLLMTVAFIGASSLVVGLVVQLLTLYATGSLMAIAFVMLIDPSTRKKALRLPMTWLAVMLARPLLFLVLGSLAKYSDAVFTVANVTGPGPRALMSALVASLALILIGLSPWALLKFAPFTPGEASSRVASQGSGPGGHTASSMAQTAMMGLAYNRYFGSGDSSGGGGGQQGAAPSGSSGTPARVSPTSGGQAAAAPAAGRPAAGAAGAGAGTGAAGAGASGAAAASGAATGGATLAAVLALQTGEAAKNKAGDVARRATDLPGE
jgi:hypothetical protein